MLLRLEAKYLLISTEFFQIFYILLISHCGLMKAEINPPKREFKVQTRGTGRSNCPIASVENCFSQSFLEMKDLNSSSDCSKYQLYKLCFNFADCSHVTASQLASQVFLSSKKKFVPKETFLALNGYIDTKCSYDCGRKTEQLCRRRMSTDEQDQDHALLLELNGQRLQIQMQVERAYHSCPKLKDTLERWAKFRSQMCESYSVFCYCQTQQEFLLRKECNLQCGNVEAYWAGSTFSLVSNIYYQIMALAVYYFLCNS